MWRRFKPPITRALSSSVSVSSIPRESIRFLVSDRLAPSNCLKLLRDIVFGLNDSINFVRFYGTVPSHFAGSTPFLQQASLEMVVLEDRR